MKTSFMNQRGTVPLVLAGLMAFCWWGGREAGKFHAVRTTVNSPGNASASRSMEKAEASAPDGEPATPESMAALLESTLQRLNEFSNLPPGTFSGHLQRAKLVSDLTEISTPRLLALVDALLAEGSPEAEEMAGRLLGPVLTARDPARVWAWLRAGAASGNAMMERFLSGTVAIFSQWAARDPQAALAAWNAEAEPLVLTGKVDKMVLGEILRSLTSSSPDAGLSALEKIGNPTDRQRMAELAAPGLWNLFEGEAADWPPDADSLVNRMLSLAGNKARAGMEEIMRARLKRQTPEEAVVWADGLNATPEQRAFIDKTIADPWMSRDPAAASTWYVDRVSARDPAAASEALERSIRKWTRAGDNNVERENFPPPDLAAASEWLIAQGLNARSQAAMATLAQAWGEAREPEAAMAWARAVPDGSARSQAVAAVTKEIRKRFPNDWESLTKPEPP